MKAWQILLIFPIICCCFTDDTVTDECETKFHEILKTKCAAIGSCTLNVEDYNCYETKECASVNVLASCTANIPPKFHEEKCVINFEKTACTKKSKIICRL